MNITWNAGDYTDHFSFVHRYGEDVLSLLDAAPGSFVVDLGCGNGALTQKLAARGYRVLGVDASPDMLEKARSLHPDLRFEQGDATHLSLNTPADAIFSNAVIHWIDANKQPQLAAGIAGALVPGGQLVCEFGGYGCAEHVHASLERAFARRGLVYPRTFYFPTIGQYAPILESAGLRVTHALLFDRPTPQEGENGLRDWIAMFVKTPFEGMADALREAIVAEAEAELADVLRQRDGTWIIDYVRIRLRAVKAA